MKVVKENWSIFIFIFGLLITAAGFLINIYIEFELLKDWKNKHIESHNELKKKIELLDMKQSLNREQIQEIKLIMKFAKKQIYELKQVK